MQKLKTGSVPQNCFDIINFPAFRNRMLNWANRFSIFCLLDNRQYTYETPAFECLLAAGCKKKIECNAVNAFEQLKVFINQNNEPLFGYFGYDLKNETEKLSSNNFDGIGFSDLFFFVPEVVIRLTETKVTIEGTKDAAFIFSAIESCSDIIPSAGHKPVDVQSRISREEYIATIKKLQQHIQRGDCYEINFCQEFFAEHVLIEPLHVYDKLTTLSPNPFSALLKVGDKYCLCASPERFLKKTGNTLISQPMKGTSKRNLNNAVADDAGKLYLLKSKKEKSENVMVVDIVRNDLSRICKEGTVKVHELFGVYSFPQVHQMISTVCGEIQNDLHWVDAIKATFPMGSMTGAPKKRVMELIEKYERTKRGLFSGAIGYVLPNSAFDFNVVIRSMLYNETSKYLSFQTGGGITYYSEAEKEYEESLLKAEAMKQVLV